MPLINSVFHILSTIDSANSPICLILRVENFPVFAVIGVLSKFSAEGTLGPQRVCCSNVPRVGAP